jgi:hypothetical protein
MHTRLTFVLVALLSLAGSLGCNSGPDGSETGGTK